MHDTILKLRDKANALPLKPGVYIMRNKSGEIIYIGKAKQLKNRVVSYFRSGALHDLKTTRMVSSVFEFDFIVTDSEFEALMLECSLIKQHSPKYNILLKDDKGFSYIKVSNEQYPKITTEFQKNDDGARYIGPFINAFGLRQLVETATIAFGIPTCKKSFPKEIGKGRACLNAHIGRCSAVCEGRISKQDYNKKIEDAVSLITKGTSEVVKKLTDEMTGQSERLEFEKAAKTRDIIASIKRMEQKQKVIRSNENEQFDVFAFAGNEQAVSASVLRFSEGKLVGKDETIYYDTQDTKAVRDEFLSHYYIDREVPKKVYCDADFESKEVLERFVSDKLKRNVPILIPQKGEYKQLVDMAYKNAAELIKIDFGRKTKVEARLGELSNLLGKKELLKRIECYDISNYGEQSVAGMSVFIDGVARKPEFRRFIIKTVSGVDDYASMAEVLARRTARFEAQSPGFNIKPDVIFLDGGKGHLSTATETLKNTAFKDVPLYGLVKDSKHRTRGIVGTAGEIEVSMHKGAFNLISTIQNETHNYTVEYQRKRHSKLTLRSVLTEIEGIGDTRAKLLMKAFKTTEALSKATIEQISDVKGMSAKSSKAVFDFFNT